MWEPPVGRRWIAIGFPEPQLPPTGPLFVIPTSGADSVLDGLLSLTWSPDGQQPLVSEANNGMTLAVLGLPHLTKTSERRRIRSRHYGMSHGSQFDGRQAQLLSRSVSGRLDTKQR